jgi:hypothetical protein
VLEYEKIMAEKVQAKDQKTVTGEMDKTSAG